MRLTCHTTCRRFACTRPPVSGNHANPFRLATGEQAHISSFLLLLVTNGDPEAPRSSVDGRSKGYGGWSPFHVTRDRLQRRHGDHHHHHAFFIQEKHALGCRPCVRTAFIVIECITESSTYCIFFPRNVVSTRSRLRHPTAFRYITGVHVGLDTTSEFGCSQREMYSRSSCCRPD